MKLARYWLTGLLVAVLLATVTVAGAQPEQEVAVTTAEELAELLRHAEPSATQGTIYALQGDVTLEASQLRQGLSEDAVRIFAGTLRGNGHTVTVTGDASGPLFEVLRGPVEGLKVVYTGDVTGAPFAYDVGTATGEESLLIRDVSVTVEGSVLPGDHDYLDYYASYLSGDGVYGNWYIHFGGQPVHLATGFAWYLWGVSLEDVQVQIHGTVGTQQRLTGDTTACGFAYFGLRGHSAAPIAYENLSTAVDGGILAYTDDGYASAYGFALGTADNQSFGGLYVDEQSGIRVTAGEITADSQIGSSSAMGYARYVQGVTHDCSVTVQGMIQAINGEGAADKAIYGYVNGAALARGFMQNTSGGINDRKDFYGNTVRAEGILAKTDSQEFAYSASASGFANQMMNTASSNPTLSYHDNHVIIGDGGIVAQSNKKGATAAGFVTSGGNDSTDTPDHIYGNTVTVSGSIVARSAQAEATATGYGYTNKSHRRACTVEVGGDILSESPTQAVSGGFMGLQYLGRNYFLLDCTVTVGGDIRAVQTGGEDGIAAAGGLAAVVMAGSSDAVTRFNGNHVTVLGEIAAQANGQAVSGQMLGLNQHGNPAKGTVELKNNTFTGQKVLLGDGQYTPFTGISAANAYSEEGNRVVFLRPGQCPETGTVTLEATATDTVDLWLVGELTVQHQLEDVPRQESTCVQAGHIAHRRCTVYGMLFGLDSLDDVLTEEEVLLPLADHTFTGPWQYDDARHWQLCSVCGTESEHEDHAFRWVTDQEGTDTLPEIRHEECSVCGYARDAVSSPPTGDTAQPLLWTALLLLSVTGGAYLLRKKVI